MVYILIKLTLSDYFFSLEYVQKLKIRGEILNSALYTREKQDLLIETLHLEFIKRV